MPKNYKKPPIIEAVIELRFANSLSSEKLKKLAFANKSKFTIQNLNEIGLTIPGDEKKPAKTETKLIGYKLTNNSDNSNIVQIKRNAISVSRLPPYSGWDDVVKNFKKHYNWYTGKKFKTLSRIGVRYINRIEIPSSSGKVKIEDYFKISVNLPETKFPDLNRFLIQTVAKIKDDLVLTVNFHSTESHLLKHVSFIFDLDVAQESKLPINDANLYKLLDEIRKQKDSFFNDLLTTKCKKLFDL